MRMFLLSLSLMAAGCSGVAINSNIPFFHSTTITVVNGTEYEGELLVDGESQGKIKPGESLKFTGKNLSGRYSAEVGMAFVVRDGARISTASRTFWIDAYNRRSETWTISRWSLQWSSEKRGNYPPRRRVLP